MRVIASGAVSLVLALGGLAVVSNPAEATEWDGHFVGFTASPPSTDVHHTSSTVSATVDVPTTGDYRVSVYDETGYRVCRSSTNTSGCWFSSTPTTDSSKTYTAYVASTSPLQGTPTGIRATAGPLTVTNTGWNGGFTGFSASPSSTDVHHPSSSVSAMVDVPTAGGYRVSVYDETGYRSVSPCRATHRGVGSVPHPRPIRRRPTPPMWLSLPPIQGTPTGIRATAGPLTVSNTGWSGSFASFEVVSTGSDWATFGAEVDTPTAGGYRVSIYDETGYRVCISGSSHPTGCSASAAWGPGEFHYFYAYVATTSPTQGTPTGIRASAGPLVVTRMTDDELADDLRAGLVPPALVPLITTLEQRYGDVGACLQFGEQVRTHALEASTSDTTTICTGLGMEKALAFLTLLVGGRRDHRRGGSGRQGPSPCPGLCRSWCRRSCWPARAWVRTCSPNWRQAPRRRRISARGW